MNIYLMEIFYSTCKDPVTSMRNNFIVFHHFITNIKDLHDYRCHIENVIQEIVNLAQQDLRKEQIKKNQEIY